MLQGSVSKSRIGCHDIHIIHIQALGRVYIQEVHQEHQSQTQEIGKSLITLRNLRADGGGVVSTLYRMIST